MNLVTGGTGFLGAYIIRHLLQQGQSVRAIKRRSSSMDLVQSFADQVEWIEADLMDIISLTEAFNGVTQVYHAAAMVSFNPKDKDVMLRTNVQGTANIVNCCLDAQVDKLVHVSSNAALGREVNQQHIDEQANWVTSRYNSNYAKSKYESELEVWRGIAEGLKAVIVNPSLIIGSGYWNDGTSAFFSRIDHGLKFYPIGTSGFVDVRDVARICGLLMQSDVERERFIVTAENLRFKDFFDMIAQAINVTGPNIEAKPWMTGIAWRIEKLKCFISGAKPMITKETATNSMHTFYYKNEKIRKALNYSFHPIEETIRESAAQYLRAKQDNISCDMLPPLVD